jgi:hypothetical protein
MGFEDRLRRIHGQTPIAETIPPFSHGAPQPVGPTFAERLNRLQVGREPKHPSASPDETVLAAVLGAEVLAPGVLLLERRLEARQRHGRIQLGAPHEPRYLSWTHANPGDPVKPVDRVGLISEAHPPTHPPKAAWLCLDTETSGLSGGTGTWVFLTGLLRAEGAGWCLRQYLLTRLDAESAYLERVAADLAPPERLLTYNGRTFDAPLLATRFRLTGRSDPLVGLPHLDLLPPTRRAFARTWPDCRLATVESRLLGVQRTDDLPGAEAPAAWLGWLRRGETDPLAAVLRHNRDDLLSLAGLLPILDAVYQDPAAYGADCRGIAAAHQSRGDPVLALRILAANRRALDAAGLHDLARLYRRSGDWAAAIGIWEELSARGDAAARTALARYHEHRGGDLARALTLAEGLPPGEARERRCRRLRTRLFL